MRVTQVPPKSRDLFWDLQWSADTGFLLSSSPPSTMALQHKNGPQQSTTNKRSTKRNISSTGTTNSIFPYTTSPLIIPVQYYGETIHPKQLLHLCVGVIRCVRGVRLDVFVLYTRSATTTKYTATCHHLRWHIVTPEKSRRNAPESHGRKCSQIELARKPQQCLWRTREVYATGSGSWWRPQVPRENRQASRRNVEEANKETKEKKGIGQRTRGVFLRGIAGRTRITTARGRQDQDTILGVVKVRDQNSHRAVNATDPSVRAGIAKCCQ